MLIAHVAPLVCCQWSDGCLVQEGQVIGVCRVASALFGIHIQIIVSHPWIAIVNHRGRLRTIVAYDRYSSCWDSSFSCFPFLLQSTLSLILLLLKSEYFLIKNEESKQQDLLDKFWENGGMETIPNPTFLYSPPLYHDVFCHIITYFLLRSS